MKLSTFQKIKEITAEYFDIIISISGIILGIAITSLYVFVSKTTHLLTLGLALIFASFLYLAIKNLDTKKNKLIHSSIKNLFDILFFILFTASVLVLHTHQGRPYTYFIIMALSTGFLSLSILLCQSKFDVVLQMTKILMMSFNLIYSIFLSYWGLGVDYWTHLTMNENLAQSGFIGVLSGNESFYPLMHIQVAIHQIITYAPIKDATNFAVVIPLVLLSIFVFLVARKLFNTRVGLLAMFIVSIADFYIYWGAAPQTTTFGVCLFFVFIFSIFQAATVTVNKKKWLFISIFLIPVLILTHAVSSFIALVAIFGLFIGSLIYRFVFGKDGLVFPSAIVFCLYGIMLLQHWFIALYNNMEDKSFFAVIVSTLDYYITEYAEFLNRPETITSYAQGLPPLIERVADTAGLTILLFFAAIGFLFWLSKKYRNSLTMPINICIILLLVITFGFPLFGLRNIIPSRWFVFMYFFLSIMAAFALLEILSRISSEKLRIAICFVSIFYLSFFMIGCTISNEDSPIWLEESTISTAYTVQEGVGAVTVTRFSERIMHDSRYSSVFMTTDFKGERFSFENEKQIDNNPNTIFMWREYMLDRPIRIYQSLDDYYKRIAVPKVLGVRFKDRLSEYNKIYENTDVIGYYLT